jgi:hypothetical protein
MCRSQDPWSSLSCSEQGDGDLRQQAEEDDARSTRSDSTRVNGSWPTTTAAEIERDRGATGLVVVGVFGRCVTSTRIDMGVLETGQRRGADCPSRSAAAAEYVFVVAYAVPRVCWNLKLPSSWSPDGVDRRGLLRCGHQSETLH